MKKQSLFVLFASILAVSTVLAVSCAGPFVPGPRSSSGAVVPFPVFDPRNPAQAMDIDSSVRGLWHQIDDGDQYSYQIGTWFFSDSLIKIRDSYLSGPPRSVIVFEHDGEYDRAIEASGGQSSSNSFNGYDLVKLASDIMLVREYDGATGTLKRKYFLVKETGASFAADAAVYTPDASSNGAPAASVTVLLQNLDDSSETLSSQTDSAGVVHFDGLKPGVFYRTFINGQASIVIRARSAGSFFGRIPVPVSNSYLIQPDISVAGPGFLTSGGTVGVPVSLRNVGVGDAPQQTVNLSVSSVAGSVSVLNGTSFVTTAVLKPSSDDGPSLAMTDPSTPTTFQEVTAAASQIDATGVSLSSGSSWVRLRLEVQANSASGTPRIYSYSFDIPVYAPSMLETLNGALSSATQSGSTVRLAMVIPGTGVVRQSGASLTGPVGSDAWIFASGASAKSRTYFQLGRQLSVANLSEAPGTLFQNSASLVAPAAANQSGTIANGDIITSYVESERSSRFALSAALDPSISPPPEPENMYASQNTRPNIKIKWDLPVTGGVGVTKYRVWGKVTVAGIDHYYAVGETSQKTVVDHGWDKVPAGTVSTVAYFIESYDPSRGWSGFGSQGSGVSGTFTAGQPYYFQWYYDSNDDSTVQATNISFDDQVPGKIYVTSGTTVQSIKADGTLVTFTGVLPSVSPGIDTVRDIQKGTGNSLWVTAGDSATGDTHSPYIFVYDTTAPASNPQSLTTLSGNAIQMPQGLAALPSSPKFALVDSSWENSTPVQRLWIFNGDSIGNISPGPLSAPLDTSTMSGNGGKAPALPDRVAIRADGKYIYVSDRNVGIHVFDSHANPIGAFAYGPETPFGATHPIAGVAINTDGKVLVAYDADADGSLYAFDTTEAGNGFLAKVGIQLIVSSANLGPTEGFSTVKSSLSNPAVYADLKVDPYGNLWLLDLSAPHGIYMLTPAKLIQD